MNKISPRSHLYQLGIVLVVFFTGFVVIRSYAVPASWNYNAWYRGDTLKDLKKLPLNYGGNESCKSCHEEVSLVEVVENQGEEEFVDEFEDEIEVENDEHTEAVMEFEHKSLNCESCHGPLITHAKGDEKIGDAIVMDKSNSQCMICHGQLISRPVDFPQFSEDVEKHKDLEEQTLCMKCHDPHDPIEEAELDEDEELLGDEL
ncbi:MAG: hypothetical protein HW411_1511 [Gammaproteobacteria bacterium]|nr:hypothetical protein [Gammaproteobacteria bacterium]